MKISRGEPIFMKYLKKYPLVYVLLSGSGHLFQCTRQLKYKKVLSRHTLIIAALYGMASPNSYSEKLQKLQNRAITVITKSSCDTTTPDKTVGAFQYNFQFHATLPLCPKGTNSPPSPPLVQFCSAQRLKHAFLVLPQTTFQ